MPGTAEPGVGGGGEGRGLRSLTLHFSRENRKKLLQAPLLHWKILFSQAGRKDLIILSRSMIFKPPFSCSLIVESLVTLSVPFHKNFDLNLI